MTHKFLSNVALDNKGGGWYDDITSVCGKVVDLYNSGGTYLQCYSLMLSCSELLRKAYHLPRSRGLSKVPLAFGGVPNFHPIHLIMVGNKSQECLLDLTESNDVRNRRIRAYLEVAGDYVIGSSETLRYRLPFHKAYEKRKDVSEENMSLLSAVSTLPDKHTLISVLKHVNKTFDRKYVYSLTGFDTDQVTLATLFYKHQIILADDTPMYLTDFLNVYMTVYLTEVVTAPDFDEYPKTNYMSYFEQTESMKFSLSDFKVLTNKSCKPIVYNTVEVYDVQVSQKNLLYLSAIEKDPRLLNIFPNPEKYVSLKEYLMSSLPGKLEDKVKFLKMYNPQESEEKNRSGYLFLPSGVNVDTASRFFTYSMLYTTRKRQISSKRPQLYTPAEFNLKARNYDDLKHFYLLVKLREQGAIDLTQMLKSLSDCKTCKEQPRLVRLVRHFDEMCRETENVEFRTKLSFVDYHKRQRRGKNIWYANADFTLYTTFGTVTSLDIEGKLSTTWEVSDPNSLSSLWSLFRIFCVSRGIRYELPAFDHTGFSVPKLAFNDFDTPYVPQLCTKAIVVPGSKVIIREKYTPLIHRRGSKFFLDDRAVDFKIYSISDVNRLFYDTHSLQGIKELIYKSDLEIDEDFLIKEFLSSKMYKVLLEDPRHMGGASDKYVRNGLLGQPGSFTRALALSDEAGLTRYRSSYNHAFINKGVIEFDSVEGVPLLDMFEKVNYARLTATEKTSFEKALSGNPLTVNDKECLVRVKNKLGLEALGTAVVLHKHVFETMVAGSIKLIPAEILKDVFVCCIDAIHAAMSLNPETNSAVQYQEGRKSYWSLIKNIVEKDYKASYLPELLALGLLRSKSDNPKVFWDVVSKNVLLSSMTVHSSYYANLVSMMQGLILKLVPNLVRFFVDEDGNARYRHYALSRVRFHSEKKSPDTLDICEYSTKRKGCIYEGEEAEFLLDADVDCNGAADEDEFEANRADRHYDGEDILQIVSMSKRDTVGLCEPTAYQEYQRIDIYNPVEYVSYPWLGLGTFSKETLGGTVFFKSSFPGDQHLPRSPVSEIKEVKSKIIRDLDFIEENKESELKFVPKIVKSKAEAMSVFKTLGIFDSRLVNALFPDKLDIDSLLDSYITDINKVVTSNLDIFKKRVAKKSFLPGFQGILEDRILTAEVKSIFGDNCYYIFNGNVRLSNSSYKYYMRILKRMSREAQPSDRALMITLMSMIVDTVPGEESDGWFVDKLNQMIEEIDGRLYDDDDEFVIYPPAPMNTELQYNEVDLFD